MALLQFIKAIHKTLGPELIPPRYRALRPPDADPSWGCCYPATEVLYHLWGKQRGWKPAYIRYEVKAPGKSLTATHWFLMKNGITFDITAQQFKWKIDYSKAVGCGFLTSQPSKRALKIMEQL